MWTENFQMNKLDFKKTEEPEIKLLTSVESSKKQEIRRKHLLLLHWMHKGLCVDHNKLWEILQEKGIPDPLYCLLRNLHTGQERTVRTRHEQQTVSKLGKEFFKAVYCHPSYLTEYRVHRVKCRVHHVKFWARWIPSWNQDCQENYLQPQICSCYHSNSRKQRGTKKFLGEGERGEWKSWLKTPHSQN